MSLTKGAILLALAAAAVNAVDPSQSVEINVILSDAKAHLGDYMSVMTTMSIPPAILEIGMAMATATDDSYTTLYSGIDFDNVNSMVKELPWYSSRLETELASALATLPSATSSAAESTSTSSSSSSSAAETSSSESASSSEQSSALPSSTDSASSTESSSSIESSSSTESSSEASSTTSAVSSSASSTASPSSSSVSSSAAQSTQTVNGAARAAFGVGAGCLGAAVFLL